MVKLCKIAGRVGWNDKKVCSIGAKAMNVLYCDLNVNEFNGISMCKNAKVRDTLDTWRY